MVDLAVDGIGDGAGLLADDEADDIELFGDTDSATMAEAEVWVYIDASGDRQDATSGDDPIAMDDDSAIVEGGILKKQCFEKWCGDIGVDTFAGGDDSIEFVLSAEDDECASLGGGHVHTSLEIGVEVDSLLLSNIVAPEEEAPPYVVVELCLGAHKEEEMAYFGLEDDDEGYEADVDDGAEDGTGEAHREQVDDAPSGDDDDDGPEDADGIGATHKTIELKDEGGDEENIDEIDESKVKKVHIEKDRKRLQRTEGDSLARLAWVVDSKSASAEEERPRVEDSGAVEGLARSAVQRLADHTLAAEAYKERLREDAREFVETREELEILLQGLGKAEARIDPYILDAEAVEPVEALGEVKGDVGNDIVVVAVGLHDSGEAAGVHHDIGDLRVGDKVEHIGVELTGTDVVDHVGTGLDGATSGKGETGVDGDDGRRESLTEGGHGSSETGSLDIGRKHNGAGT